MVSFAHLRHALVVLGLLALTSTSVSAAVLAQVDRPAVDLNESFMLEVIVDTNIDLEPDLTVLEADFHVGQISQLVLFGVWNS